MIATRFGKKKQPSIPKGEGRTLELVYPSNDRGVIQYVLLPPNIALSSVELVCHAINRDTVLVARLLPE